MNKSTEEFLTEITKELDFLKAFAGRIFDRIEQIEETVEKVYERIDNVSNF